MAAKFIPLGDRILVSVIAQDKMLEGVLLPDSSKEDMQVAVVIAVGEVKSVSIGDHIAVGPWAGKDIQIEGIPFRVVREEEIDGKIVHDEANSGSAVLAESKKD